MQSYGGDTLDNYTVKLTGRARRDLDSVYRYIADELQESGTAGKMLDVIENEIRSLKNMPSRCPERRRGLYADKGYRQLLVKNYTIVYRVDEEKKQVIIVTIRYSRSLF